MTVCNPSENICIDADKFCDENHCFDVQFLLSVEVLMYLRFVLLTCGFYRFLYLMLDAEVDVVCLVLSQSQPWDSGWVFLGRTIHDMVASEFFLIPKPCLLCREAFGSQRH